jgi:hypothetical protein
MLSTRAWLTFLPTNTTSRKWRATPLRHDATLTKSRSDVSRPTDAFRKNLCQVAQPFVSPSLISLRTCLKVADALTKRRTDVSRPTDAFRNICLGGANMYLQHRRCQVATGFASPYKHTLRVFSCCLRVDKTRGFRFTIQAHQGCLHRSRTCRDDFLHIGAELAEMIL